MLADGPGDLVEIERNLNAEQYVNILDEVMLPNVQRRYGEEDHPRIVVVEDNSPIHIARITRAWYKNHSEIVRLNWSADLNNRKSLGRNSQKMNAPHCPQKRRSCATSASGLGRLAPAPRLLPGNSKFNALPITRCIGFRRRRFKLLKSNTWE